VLVEGTLGYKVMLMIYRVCLVKALWVTYKAMLIMCRVYLEKTPWVIK